MIGKVNNPKMAEIITELTLSYCALYLAVVQPKAQGIVTTVYYLRRNANFLNEYCFLKTYHQSETIFLELGRQSDLTTPFWYVSSLLHIS